MTNKVIWAIIVALLVLVGAISAFAADLSPVCVYDPKRVKHICDTPSQRTAYSNVQAGGDGSGGTSGDSGASSGDADAGSGDPGSK